MVTNKKRPLQFLTYAPGLISLMLLLPLLLLQMYRYGVFEKLRVIEVNWYSPDVPYAKLFEFPPQRDYLTIEITGDEQEDGINLDFAQRAIREMVNKYDMVRGVRIHFSDTARYESFVRALDICNQENILNVPYENDLWIFNRIESKEESKPIPFVCGTPYFLRSIKQPEKHATIFPFAYNCNSRLLLLDVMLVVLALMSLRKLIRVRPRINHSIKISRF